MGDFDCPTEQIGSFQPAGGNEASKPAVAGEPVRKLLIWLPIFAATLALAGFLYHRIAVANDARLYPEPGRSINIGGSRWQIHCAGAGSPTVVLEAGLGDVLTEWSRVQPAVAVFSRVCSYDRAGYGGSDAGPMPRTSAVIAKELHALLQAAGEKPPYVLVGSSFGGYNVRVFNGQHPEEVAGIVLVDSTQEDQYRLLPKPWQELSVAMRSRYTSQAHWAPFFIELGGVHVMLRFNMPPGSHLILQSKYVKARASELENIEGSAEQARASGNIGSKPLLVLTAGRNSDSILMDRLTRRDLDDYERTWIHVLQPRLASLSSVGRQIVVSDSGHDMPAERPEAIVKAIRTLCSVARVQ